MDFNDALVQLGWLGLFLINFIAATPLPISSEPVLLALQLLGYDPIGIFAVSLTGSSLGAFVNYFMGRFGRNMFLARMIEREPAKMTKAQELFDRWGDAILFISWLPLAGDVVTVLAGAARTHPVRFLLWVTAGKAVRYAVLIALTTFAIDFFNPSKG